MNPTVCAGSLLYVAKTKRFLFLHRMRSKQNLVWGLPGGTLEFQESAWQACSREITEEIGPVSISKTMPLERFLSRDGLFEYHTYLCLVDNEFIPALNDEHNGYAWVEYGFWPKPLHYGVKKTLLKKSNITKIETIIGILND